MKKKTFLFIILALTSIALLITSCGTERDDDEADKATEALFELELNDDGESYRVVALKDEKATEVTIPKEYKGKPITVIGDRAFAYKISMERVSIPDSVIEIGEGAFTNTHLVEVIIPNSVTKIGVSAFSSCERLEKVTLPSSITKIEDVMFSGCESLVEINIPSSVTSIGGSAFSGCKSLVEIDLPDSVVELERGAFYGCSSLRAIRLSDNIKSIGVNTFYECRSLTEINLPNNLEYIGDKAFEYCVSIMFIDFPNTLTEIGERAFGSCVSLLRVTLPQSIERIGAYAFSNCESLYEICNKSDLDIALGSKYYGEIGFYTKHITEDSYDSYIKTVNDFIFYDDGESVILLKYTGYEGELVLPQYENGKKYDIKKGVLLYGNKINSIVLSDTVNRIERNAFNNCDFIESVTFDCHEAQINVYAFGHNNRTVKTVYINTEPLTGPGFGNEVQHYYYNAAFQNLENVYYGEGVKTVYAGEFRGDSGIKNIVLSSSIEDIGENAFYGCRNATIVIPEDVKITEIKKGVFYQTKITSFVFNDSITYIGEEAFARSRLQNITLGKNIVEIGASAFSHSQLQSVTLNEGLKVVGDYAFSGCTNLSSIVLPDSVEIIGKSAFSGCSLIYRFEIGENSSLHTLKASAFAGCSTLGYIKLPKTLTTIEPNAFSATRVLNFVIHEDNPAYTVFEGNLYNKDLTVLVCVAPQKTGQITILASVKKIEERAFAKSNAKSVVFAEGSVLEEIGKEAFYYASVEELMFPSSLKVIGESAFSHCQSLSTVSFGENATLETIGKTAFTDCFALDSLTIPASVRFIDDGAFVWMGSLTLYYNGTVAEWEAIEKGEGLFNGSHQLGPLYIYCTDQTIEIN